MNIATATWAERRQWLDEILKNHHENPDQYSKGVKGEDDVGWQVNPRYSDLAGMIPKGRLRVVDVGIGMGGLLALLFVTRPELRLHGLDFSKELIDRADRFLKKECGGNPAQLICASPDQIHTGLEFDVVICSEVLEHQVDYMAFLEALEKLAVKDGLIILTVPSGPWEPMSFTKPREQFQNDYDKNRAHVHHFESRDLEEIFDKKKDLRISYKAGMQSARGEQCGWWYVSWRKSGAPFGKVDYERKFQTTRPYQKLAYCMIVRNEEQWLVRHLRSIIEVPDEITILDTGSTDSTPAIVEMFQKEDRYAPRIYYRRAAWDEVRPVKGTNGDDAESGIDGKIEAGQLIDFSRARNLSIEGAIERGADWILWGDADEVFKGAANIRKYIRGSAFHSAFVLRQRHVTLTEEEALRTDTPYRLFRPMHGGKPVRFFGVVHEQPAFAINENPEPALHIPDAQMVHFGYMDEGARRAKVVNRNMALVGKDLIVNPTRIIGKLNVMRDYVQLAELIIERHGGVTTEAVYYLRHAIGIFHDTFEIRPRHIYYSYASVHYVNALKILGQSGVSIEQGLSAIPFEVQLQLAIAPGGISDSAQIVPGQRRWYGTRAEFEREMARQLDLIFGKLGGGYARQKNGASPGGHVPDQPVKSEAVRHPGDHNGGGDAGRSGIQREAEAGGAAGGLDAPDPPALSGGSSG